MSREDVIRQIVERDLQRLGLTEESVSREAPDLFAAASEFFGTWDTALQYAGISDRRAASRAPRNKASRRRQLLDSALGPEIVVKEIQRLCMTGYDLTASHNLHRDRQLYEASPASFRFLESGARRSWRKLGKHPFADQAKAIQPRGVD